MKSNQRIFGLLGKELSHSFSKTYFEEKFAAEGIEHVRYLNFEIPQIEDFPLVLTEHLQLRGMNVTIPYKESVFAFVDHFDPVVKEVKATNTLLFDEQGITAYNTDVIGFRESLRPFLKPRHERALILGSGGAAKAVKYALNELGIRHLTVSRNPHREDEVAYSDLAPEGLEHWKLIVNTTPLGTLNENEKPSIPYDGIGSGHLLYDLVYNPPMTAFLKEGNRRGAVTLNGLDMLKLQAEASWKIWNS